MLTRTMYLKSLKGGTEMHKVDFLSFQDYFSAESNMETAGKTEMWFTGSQLYHQNV